MLWSLIGLILVGFIVIIWRNAMDAKKRANDYAKFQCNQHHYQFLDDTAVLKKIYLKRDQTRYLSLWRNYQFDYCDIQGERKTAELIFCGEALVSSTLLLKNNVVQFRGG